MKLVKQYDNTVTISKDGRSVSLTLKELTQLRKESGELLDAHIEARAKELLDMTFVGKQHYEKSPTRTQHMNAYMELAKLEIGGQLAMTIDEEEEGVEFVRDDIVFTGSSAGEADGKEGKVS